jgi:hypothetical protein
MDQVGDSKIGSSASWSLSPPVNVGVGEKAKCVDRSMDVRFPRITLVLIRLARGNNAKHRENVGKRD